MTAKKAGFNLPFSNLTLIQTSIFDVCRFNYTAAILEPESIEYYACYFELNNLSVRFRTAKITPKKPGQFVTLWKRPNEGEIQPFDALDGIDLVVIAVNKEKLAGHFVFPASVLCRQGIFTANNREGKRGFRVYPPWYKTLNAQATKTQSWQLHYFVDLSDLKTLDIVKAKQLYSNT